MAERRAAIRRLINPVRHYAWGSHSAIAELLGQPVPSAEPQAELWMGSHGQGSSEIELDGRRLSLRQWLRQEPETLLGRHGGSQDDELHFLLKVLAAQQPLSVQAHPDAAQAAAGFAREQAAGVPVEAAQRNYRDPHAKPEILVALTPFALIRGFRAPGEISRALQEVGIEATSPLRLSLGGDDAPLALRTFFETCMALDPAALGRLQRQVLEHLDAARGEHRWVERLCRHHGLDRGFLAPLWLHYLELAPGEAIFTPPGILHAYLEGVGIELMGSSDNVLRGGLTVKHVDIPELLAVVQFAPQPPEVLRPVPGPAGEHCFEAPTDVFRLSRLQPAGSLALTVDGPEILLCTEGSGKLSCDGEQLTVGRGEAVFVAASAGNYTLQGQGVFYRAREGHTTGSRSVPIITSSP